MTHSPPVATQASLELTPLECSPDGGLRLLVRVRYRASDGRVAHHPPGGRVDVAASRGSVQWQPRRRYGDPAAIVRVTEPGPLEIRVASDIPRDPTVLRAVTDTRAWRLPSVTARALGPHAVVVGWFPVSVRGVVRVERRGDGVTARFAVAAPATSLRDATAVPGASYTYLVRRPGAHPIAVGVDMPPAIAASGPDVLRGKAMWLADDEARRLGAAAIVDGAVRAGLRAVLLRLTYGELATIAPGDPLLDALVDGLAAHRIAVVAWVVPRAVSFADIATAVAAVSHRTPHGKTIAGLAVDLERGPDFLNTGDTRGPADALAAYVRLLRAAVGPHVLIVATVEDPVVEAIAPGAVPYAAIAASADVVQPMVYWRARPAGRTTAGLTALLATSVAELRRRAGPRVAIDIGGQTADLGAGSGAPPPGDVAASIVLARRLGAIGETFFDWQGTTSAQWQAIAATPWPPAQRASR